jgi:DNA-binding response OmpR family regulator
MRRFRSLQAFLPSRTYIVGTVSRADAPSQSPRALVIDDDAGVQGLFNTLLSRDGFAVDSVANGRQAFECLKSTNYSVILLDLMMPDVNGFELLDRLERDSPALLRRIIVMTGAAQRVVDGLDTKRVYGLIRKPFDINDLLASARACARGGIA